MTRVCFVCLGNICRSPMAEFVMKAIAEGKDYSIESRGTSDWEHGNPIHQGTQSILKSYQIPYSDTKRSMPFTVADFDRYDYIIGMDKQNVQDLRALSNGQYDEKIHLFCDGGVPDPWYTGDFEETYGLVTRGCQKWLTIMENEKHV